MIIATFVKDSLWVKEKEDEVLALNLLYEEAIRDLDDSGGKKGECQMETV